MKKLTTFFVGLAIMALPFSFTSCSDDEPYRYNTPSYPIVDEAVQNYHYLYQGGTDYLTAYNFFFYYYPNATEAEFQAFMNAIGMGNNYEQNATDALVQEAQVLSGEWEGDMIYQYDDENATRQQLSFTANMKFFRYQNSQNQLRGYGVETDTDNEGHTQALDFSWFINNSGDIIIKYKKSGKEFKMDISSKNQGFFLGYNQERGYDVFYGYGLGTNCTDAFYIDLSRQATNYAKGMTRATTSKGALAGKSFGNATSNKINELKAKAVNKLHIR